jgi:chaperonin cofactor prefoldin
MAPATASEVHTELKAHERECAVRAEATQRQLDSLTSRIRRLEAIIMGSTLAVILGIITLMWKVLQLPV